MVNSSKLFLQIVASIKKTGGIGGVHRQALPVCTGCGLSYAYAVGAEDFTDAIAKSRATLEKLRELRAVRYTK